MHREKKAATAKAVQAQAADSDSDNGDDWHAATPLHNGQDVDVPETTATTGMLRRLFTANSTLT